MECPNCHHKSQPGVLIKCQDCGASYERGILEEYEHVHYLLDWLEEHRVEMGENATSLIMEMNSRKTSLRERMHLPADAKPVITSASLTLPSQPKPVAPLPAVPTPAPVSAPTPKPVELPAPPRPAPAAPAMAASVTTPIVSSRPVAVPVPTPKPVESQVQKPAPKPVAPPKPPINWGKLWDNAVNFVVSGALLRALLYMGAFMIVVSALVLVISFWDKFGPVLQVVFVFALPAFFYAAGWLIRTRLKLQQTGTVLTGVGAILLAVGFVGVYKLSNLSVDINQYWLVASLITTAIYIFTALRLKGEFFGYLTLLSGVSVFLSLTRVLNASLEWTVAVVPAAGLLMTILAVYLQPRADAWQDLARPARYLPQMLVPLGLFVILFVGGPDSQAGKMIAFLCAAAAYGLLAWKFPVVWQLVLSLVSLLVAVVFGVQLFDITNLWLPTAGSILAGLYILTGWRFFAKQNSRHDYLLAFYLTGFLLSAVVLAAGLSLYFSGKHLEVAIPFNILALSFCLWNVLLKQPLLGFIGAALLLFPFWQWLDLAQVQTGFYPLAYLLLISFGYLPASLLLERTNRKLASPFTWVGWLCSGGIFITACALNNSETPWASALTLTLLAVYYAFNAWHFHQATFAWCTTLVLSLSVMLWIWFWVLPIEYSALVWLGLAFIYLLTERFLSRLTGAVWGQTEFRQPLKAGVFALALLAWGISLIAYNQLFQEPARLQVAVIGQALVIALTILSARLYRSRWPLFVEPALAALLAVLFFNAYAPVLLGHTLEWYQYGLVVCGIAWLHLLIAAGLDPLKTRYAHGLYLGGYGLAALSVLWTVFDLPSLLWTLGAFILAMAASAILQDLKRHHTWDEFSGLFGAPEKGFTRQVRNAFQWLSAWLLPIWCVLLLAQQEVPGVYRWLALSLPALLYLALGRLLSKRDSSYALPFFSAAHVYTLLAFFSNLDGVLNASQHIAAGLFNPIIYPDGLQNITGQGLVLLAAALFYGLWAWMKGQRLFAHISAWLSLLPFTSLLLLLQRFSPQQIVIAWAGWAGLLLLAGFLLDRAPQAAPRHAHGPYLAGYVLSSAVLFVSLQERVLNIIVLGLYIIYAVLSAFAVHFNHHRTWDEFAGLFGFPKTSFGRVMRGAFLWAAAWLFPLWCAQVLIQLKLPYTFRWLALSLPALLFLFLGQQLSKRESTYAWPFFSAAHIYTLLALFFSLGDLLAGSRQIVFSLSNPLTGASTQQIFMGQGLVQLAAFIFYSIWAWMKRQSFFAHVAAWLSILPFTSLLFLLPGISPQQIVIAWAAWAGLLLLAGFLLDRAPQYSPRYAHGPYLAGYMLALACLVTASNDLWLTNVILGLCILYAAASAVVVHFRRHLAWEDFINFIWYKETLLRRGTHLLFLFFAVYALPIWIFLLEKNSLWTPAWQGVSLALLAPLSIAAGLYLRRFNPDYTWPFYSAGYTLTALGAMLAVGDQRLAIWVFILNIAVYAASAVIFRKTIWLYLATFLLPVTALMVLNYNSLLVPTWTAWTFMVITFIYFGAGQFLDRQRAKSSFAAAWAAPFYAPAYLLSAASLVVASGNSHLALGIFPACILLYALSAWRFHEPLFVYPAAWLSIVPYYLAITLYTAIPPLWYGLSWLPLIVTFILLGRFVFRRAPFDLTSPRAIFNSLNQVSAPFYFMAYALSLSMVFTSQASPLSFTVACAAAMLLYLASALLFRHPAWLYPTLLFGHLTILAYFSIHPTASPARMITVPFLLLTWLEALAGYLVSRRYPITEMAANGKLVFKFFGKEMDFGAFPSLGYLSLPSWAQPIFIVVAIDTFLWESLALTGLDTGVIVSAGFFLLLSLLATLWQDSLLAYLSLALGSLAASLQLQKMGYTTQQAFTGLTGLAFGLYLLSWLADWLKGALTVWRKTLVNIAVALSVLGLLVTLPWAFVDSIPAGLALIFAGALYMSMSLRRRTYLLGYLGMGLLLAGWSLLLFKQNITEPQFYAVPAGLYFVGMGFFERRRHPGRFAMIIESLGFALLLFTSFTQSINGASGFIYFLLLLVEGLLVIGWGAYWHFRVPFIIGLAASVLNVLAQVAVLINVYQINRWLIIFGVGFLIMGIAVYGNWRREQLVTQGQGLRDMLEKWE